MTRVQMFIETAQYVRSHGKAPRGSGNWGFEYQVVVAGALETRRAWCNGTYSEARRMMAKVAKKEGAVIVAVLP